MAVTIKRGIPELNNNTQNNSRHFNQMTFKGIVQNNNPYDVDQLSLKDALNVYVDENGTLSSRPPIVGEALPTGYLEITGQTIETPIVPTGFDLVDIFETGRVTVYVSVNSHKQYHIVIYNKTNGIIKIVDPVVNKYHITAIENYVIVFNDIDAVVININKYSEGWMLLKNEAEVPVTKRVVGSETFTYPGNQFTANHQEDYVWSQSLISLLPEGDATVVVTQSPKNLTWTLPDANINTEFRILRSLNIKTYPDDIISVATNPNIGLTVIAVARPDHVMISRDNGQSFERVLYPAHGGFLQVASVSKDALHFFFVAVDAVYRYDLGSITDGTYSPSAGEWVAIRIEDENVPPNMEGVGQYNTCYFLSGEAFTFVLYDGDVANIYVQGPNLNLEDYTTSKLSKYPITGLIDISTQLNPTRRDISPYSMYMWTTTANDETTTHMVAWLPGLAPTTSTLVGMRGLYQGHSTATAFHNVTTIETTPYGIIRDVVWQSSSATEGTFIIDCITTDNDEWYEYEVRYKRDDTAFTVEFTPKQDLNIPVSTGGAPIDLTTGLLVDFMTYSVDGQAPLPTKLNSEVWPGTNARWSTLGDGPYYYLVVNGTIYTNQLIDDSSVVISYLKLVDTPYTQVPNVSHVNNELYLGFDNLLKITANERTGVDIKFNLPAINNHSFTSEVTAMINVSTDRVAIFLTNQIFIVMQVPDELLGYRYDYYNTRLSTGVRLGDSVINTRDGMLTLYPTRQGLAVMNYQPDVTNIDQVVSYISNNIIKLWTEFYLASSPIEMVQMRDYVFITNNTTRYLILDLRTMSWWSMTSPVPIMKITTDQININIVSNGLYTFDLNPINYRDLKTKFIDWKVESQPNHFTAPNHYKNMRQLIFHLEEATKLNQTIVTQIKLYRKTLTLREPEIISFKIESYRTFIKRFNYWKINELQWAIGADNETETPAPLKLNGITVKYEIADEVRS